ncbi:endomembrane system acetyl-CoA transmembrane transporter [Schizosaccharomyces osmophilus]|uniref:Endomembrane system acetyl-CoA transmembrane transporter n=1 Tax=Schizosaccharomyces osmophilus TaxID=2545709 RepID=A0AAE9W7U7_9SCHI|nr:endomembrane system acetyl-CoA transmembrane transporter [Schizosaccharomyces osmophilus]WBW70990.1 endomembrane system acetyl-CoA transmembrane transporter [Schizosaccharomyces osmophilus]
MLSKLHQRAGRSAIELKDLENGAVSNTLNLSTDDIPDDRGSYDEVYPPLSFQQKKNIAFLILLYLIQGVPMGLVKGSIPYFLKPHCTYSDIATYSLASYPYSLKVLWSPIVDTYYFSKFGRRKTWVAPCTFFLACTLLVFSYNIDVWIERGSSYIKSFTVWSFFLVFICATQDIAVDGWSLNMLDAHQLNYASTAQTVGLNTGFFLSFTVLLVLTSPEFANTVLRISPLDEGLITLSGYIRFWALITLFSVVLVFVWEEQKPEHVASMKDTFRSIRDIISLRNMKQLLAVHLLSKVGFVANETLTLLKATEFGLSKAMLSLIILINFPLGLILGVYIGHVSNSRPLHFWLWGYWGRTASIVLNMALVYTVTHFSKKLSLFLSILICYTLNASFMTIQFVSIGVFHSQISDPAIGGTYMTILNTLSNLGGTWPQYIMLKLADWVTYSYCSTDHSLQCITDDVKNQCVASGGQCIYKTDGYYFTSILGIFLSILLCIITIFPIVRKLNKVPASSWHIHGKYSSNQ